MPSSILNWKTRRRLLESRKKPLPADLSRAGRELLEAGRPAEAWEFFKRADDRPALEEIRKLAVAEGDFFLYALAAASLGLEPDTPAVTELAGNAREKGLLAYMARALASLEPKIQGNASGEADASGAGSPSSGASPESPAASGAGSPPAASAV
jgi:hypothetical protein